MKDEIFSSNSGTVHVFALLLLKAMTARIAKHSESAN